MVTYHNIIEPNLQLLLNKVESRLNQCQVGGETVLHFYRNYRNELEELLENGTFTNKFIENLCMTEGACHENAADVSTNNPDVCHFWGFAHEAGTGAWSEHSWLVNKKGQVIETWWKTLDGYFGIPIYDERLSPKRGRAGISWVKFEKGIYASDAKKRKVCKTAYKASKQKDKTNGCRI